MGQQVGEDRLSESLQVINCRIGLGKYNALVAELENIIKKTINI